MKKFILGKNVAYSTQVDFSDAAPGSVGVFYLKDGVVTSTKTGAEITEDAMLVLGRTTQDGGPVVVDLNKHHFSFVKGEYQQSTTFSAHFTVKAPTKVGDYSVIIVKKGKGFNERNKWTSTIHVTDTSMNADALAKAIAEDINRKTVGSGVKAVPSSAQVTVTAVNKGENYGIVMADELYGIKVTETAKGMPAYGDAAYVEDLDRQAAADKGYEYIDRSAEDLMYPDYPLDALKQPRSSDVGFTIFTLRFSVPRHTRAVEDLVNQVVQIALPTGTESIGTLETIFKAMAGESAGAVPVAASETV